MSEQKAPFDEGLDKAKDAINAGTEKVKAYQAQQEAQQREILKDSAKFVDQSETAVATLGNSYLQNFLLGKKVKRGAAIVTQKRLYYFGKGYLGKGRHTVSCQEENVIPLESISQTRFTHRWPIGSTILGIVCLVVGLILFGLTMVLPGSLTDLVGYPSLVLMPAGLLFTVIGFLSRGTTFEISFPGGKYLFPVKYYPIADMRDFQRQLHLMRDNLKNG